MPHRSAALALACCAALLAARPSHATADADAINNDVVERSLLDEYTAERDAAFAWTLERTYTDQPGFTGHAVNLTSQAWRSPEQVDYPAWTHMMQIVRPDDCTTDTALLLIAGGQRRQSPPREIDNILYMMARATGGPVVFLPNVPNQPLTVGLHLPGENGIRFEDDLLAESWVLAAREEDPSWIIHLAMVESAVAAMDAAQAFLATDEGGNLAIDRFVVSGGSKRGWTTWLTAAVDDRVRAIIPLVIDTLNLPATMRHHWQAYGFWAPAIGDYTGRRLFRWLGSPDGRRLREIVDPYLYRDRLDMPKFLLNSAGDQYFLPDTTRHYLDDLPGTTRLRVVPNTNHALDRNFDAVQSAIAFHQAVAAGVEIPALHAEPDANDAALLRITTTAEPFEVTLWQATNPAARDFRQETIGNAWTLTLLEPDADGVYTARVPEPDAGFTAYLVQARFRVEGVDLPLTFTTQVRVTPDIFPHADKPME